MRKYCIQFPNLVSDFFFSVSVKLCYADAESSLDKEEIPWSHENWGKDQGDIDCAFRPGAINLTSYWTIQRS